MKELEFNVKGMECVGCENRIKNALSQIKGVKQVTANHSTGKVNILLQKDLTDEIKDTIINSLETIGFDVED